MTKFMDESVLVETAKAIRENGSQMAAARALGITKGALDHRVREIKRRKILDSGEFSVASLPSYQASAEEIIQRKFRVFNRRKAAKDARDVINVKVRLDGPIGILHMGDPHLDDDGTNIKLVMQHLELPEKHEGLFRACVGDYLNNWRGKLAPLHAMQSTTQQEAHKLLEWFIRRPKWLYLIAGNHDCHDEQTECLTRRGWVHYSDIRDDDLVLSFVTGTGGCEWAPILKRITRQHDGEMVGIETQSISLNVTPNHRILCRDRDWKRTWREWSYKAAGSLPARVALPSSARVAAAGVFLSDEQIALAGWILTDGSIQWQGNMPRVTLYQSKDGAEIGRLLAALQLTFRHRVRERAISAVAGRALLRAPKPQSEWTLDAASSRRVLEWLPEKGRLPDWAHSLTAAQFDVLLGAIVAGDGCWDGVDPVSRNVAVVHGTEAFLSSLQAVAVQHGYNARLSIARGKDYRLNLCRRETIQFETGPATTRTNYSGTVWCLTVPRGNFMIRRNGAAHFSGNCWTGDEDPLIWFTRGLGAVYEWHGARLKLAFPKGDAQYVNVRHDFPGSSIYNRVQGGTRAIRFGGTDDLYIQGHKHTNGHYEEENSIGGWSHAVQIASYKEVDDFPHKIGLTETRLGAACVTVHDPAAKTPHARCRVFWDVEQGADFLKWLRKRK